MLSSQKDVITVLNHIKKNELESITATEIRNLLKCAYSKASRLFEDLLDLEILTDKEGFRKPVNNKVLNKRLKAKDFSIKEIEVNAGPYTKNTKHKLLTDPKILNLSISLSQLNLNIHVNKKDFSDFVEWYINSGFKHDIQELNEIKDIWNNLKSKSFINVDEIDNAKLKRLLSISTHQFIQDFKFGLHNKGKWESTVEVEEEGYIAGPTAGGGVTRYILSDETILTQSNFVI